MPPIWHTGRVIRILDETPSTRRFWIEVLETPSFDFQPGQFVTLDLPLGDKPAKRWRSYSIASWPDGTNVIELVIVLLEGGAGTQYLFQEIREGSTLSLRGPQGKFTLPPVIDRDLYFICTGTGIAPFRSMVHHIYNRALPHQDLHLIFGCRTFGDALYHGELKALEQQLPGFRYWPTFSREKPRPDFPQLQIGYVHAVYEAVCREKLGNGHSSYQAAFYLCGWKAMIDEAKQRITQLGFERKAIHLELYG